MEAEYKGDEVVCIADENDGLEAVATRVRDQYIEQYGCRA